MAQFRRATLILLLLLAGCSRSAGDTTAKSDSGPQTVPGGELVLTTPAGPGSLTIVNRSVTPVEIALPIAVETRGATGWSAIATEFNAVASCRVPAATGPVLLAAGATLTVVRWQGYSCSGQCEESCRANIPAGPGPFRFVVSRAPGGVRVIGPTFTMPPADAG